MLVIASSMSLSLGLGFFLSSAAAAMICPDWQYPHCGTSSAAHAFCTGCELLADRPSMVTIRSPALTLPTGIEHDRRTSPLMCTEHAPHCATPQPYLVPARPTCSRMTHSRGVSLSTCTSRTLPLMLSFAMRLLLQLRLDGDLGRATRVAAPGSAWRFGERRVFSQPLSSL